MKTTGTTNKKSGPVRAPSPKIQIPDRLYFRIGDVAELLGIKPSVLRFWESEFPMIHPEKSSSGQRVYRRSDVETVVMIKRLLYEERYSIEGAQKRIRELRKDGELKEFKEKTVSRLPNSEAPPSALSSGTQLPEKFSDEVKTIVSELQSLSKINIKELFKY